jgi:hypothetical protein
MAGPKRPGEHVGSVNVRLSQSDLAYVRHLVEREGVTVSGAVRYCIAQSYLWDEHLGRFGGATPQWFVETLKPVVEDVDQLPRQGTESEG